MAAAQNGLLAPAGVSEPQERVYRALLRRPGLAVSALAAETRLSLSETRHILASLENAGLVSRDASGRTSRFFASSPEIAIETLIRQRREELEAMRSASAALIRETRQSPATDPSDMVRVVTGPRAFASQCEQLTEAAEREMLGFDRPPYEKLTVSPRAGETLARDVDWRVVYAQETVEMEGALDHIAECISSGEKARVAATLPIRMIIADRRLAVITLSDDLAHFPAAIVKESLLLDALVELFEDVWERAVPLIPSSWAPTEERVREEGGALTARDAKILALMASGSKDESIARALNVDISTVRRRITKMMKALGVNSRFQAGIQAVRKGWLEG